MAPLLSPTTFITAVDESGIVPVMLVERVAVPVTPVIPNPAPRVSSGPSVTSPGISKPPRGIVKKSHGAGLKLRVGSVAEAEIAKLRSNWTPVGLAVTVKVFTSNHDVSTWPARVRVPLVPQFEHVTPTLRFGTMLTEVVKLVGRVAVRSRLTCLSKLIRRALSEVGALYWPKSKLYECATSVHSFFVALR